MAPTKPAAKGRGRPKGSDAEASPAPIASDAAPVKRGRGRPPKDPSGLPQRILNPKVAKPAGPGRKRGRPPKDPNAPPKTPVKKAAKGATSSTGRPRGRPPGAGKKQSNSTKEAALENAVAGAAGPAKKGRGRPSKARPSEDAVEHIPFSAPIADEDDDMDDAEADLESEEVDKEEADTLQHDTNARETSYSNSFLGAVGRTLGFGFGQRGSDQA
ncbi:hypothetical protein BD289DRAFT_44987 [Coniella lustricola]|uniref:Uncharacterized protein n=1 Tax=Coniella lustricola TaxID=2025994 RepID=A0A2T3A1K0_9PEZI|nr:hypothetical protein BD289DRAFT_44987 [Coniella lustricola]